MNETAGNETGLFRDEHISFKVYRFQAIFHPIAFAICVPMNLIVAYVLIADRRLHSARNAIWLGVVGSNLLVYFMIGLQYLVFVEENYTACRLFSFIIGKPYAILLINQLLATCDRIIYTKWPLFHQRHVTVPRVVACQLICSTGAFLTLSFHFLTGMKPILCGIDPQNAKLLFGVVGVLIFLCIVAKLTVYFMTLKCSVAKRNGLIVKRVKICKDNGFVRELSRPSMRIHCGSRKFRSMEWNATMTLVANLIPLVLLASLSCLYVLSQFVCRQLLDNCETLNHLEIFFRELALFHVSTNLLVYIFRSVEFKSAASSVFPILSPLRS